MIKDLSFYNGFVMNFFTNLMYKIFPFIRQCQSCGFTLSKDEHRGGTNKDGSRNIDYCSMCFWNGEFLSPAITQEELLVKLQLRCLDMGMPERIVHYIVNKVRKEMHTYKRWQNI